MEKMLDDNLLKDGQEYNNVPFLSDEIFADNFEEQEGIEEEAPVKAIAQEWRLFADYAKEVGETLCMTRDDGKRFGALLHVYAKKIESYKRLMESVPKKSARYKKYKALFDNCRSRYTRIRNIFVSRNLRLVIMFVKSYKRSRAGALCPLLDTIQMGNIGLIKAVERFDWRKGYTFATYALWWIRQAITRGVPEQEKLIRIPAYVLERSKKVFAIADDERSKGKSFSSKEIAQYADLSMEAVQDIFDSSKSIQSLDEPWWEGEGRIKTLHDILPDGNTISPDRNTIHNHLKDATKDAFSHLTERERDIIQRRFGFTTQGDCETLDMIGKRYGLTRERIRQIENTVLKKIRNNPRINENLYSFRER